MKLSTKGKYGVQALFALAIHEGTGPLSLKAIADQQGLSEHYLEQLAAPLRKAGLVESIRGAQGGYILARPTNKITMGDIIRVLEGPIGFADSPNDPRMEDPVHRVVNRVWEQVSDRIVEVVDSVTLYDLVEQAKVEQSRETLMFEI
jgi:Rrf2 family cysteine metabolism transcriptional repressor